MKPRIKIAIAVGVTLLFSGCTTYRGSSNITPANTHVDNSKEVFISEKSLPANNYKSIQHIEVSVKKLTVFDKDPTKSQANTELMKSARAIGADAVINVKYKSGVGFTTWGYIDAEGDGVKLIK